MNIKPLYSIESKENRKSEKKKEIMCAKNL